MYHLVFTTLLAVSIQFCTSFSHKYTGVCLILLNGIMRLKFGLSLCVNLFRMQKTAISVITHKMSCDFLKL